MVKKFELLSILHILSLKVINEWHLEQIINSLSIKGYSDIGSNYIFTFENKNNIIYRLIN